jgi:hypothetical protein
MRVYFNPTRWHLGLLHIRFTMGEKVVGTARYFRIGPFVVELR